MLVAFLSGAYTSKSLWQQKQNIQEAEKIAVELWQMGFAVICPHANTSFFDGAIAYETFLSGDLAILERCDIHVMMPHWVSSHGSQNEHAYSLREGKQIYYWQTDRDKLVELAKRSGPEKKNA